ncbi:hypothetical protein TeGR_g40, partial [Tetraparma gracilis]
SSVKAVEVKKMDLGGEGEGEGETDVALSLLQFAGLAGART